MSESVHASISDRINQLTERERKLRSEISSIRLERSRLKAQCGGPVNLARPRWVSELPEAFWYPCYYTSKVISNLSPNLDNGNVPPDLIDWSKNSGTREFLINIAMYVGVIIIALQVFFLIF
jgi:hypothetical protein